MKFNCPFCQKPMRKFHDTEYTRVEYLQCDFHGATRVRYNPLLNDAYCITLVVIHKDNLYHMTFFYNLVSQYKFQITKIRRWPHTSEFVMRLEEHPNITPDNAEKKLLTMIMFS